jgi:hypothetical protein
MLGRDVASAEAGWRFLNALRDTENLAEAQQRWLPNAALSPTRPAGRVDRSGADRRIGRVFLKSPLTIRRMTAPSSTLQACSCCATSTEELLEQQDLFERDACVTTTVSTDPGLTGP